MGRFDTAGTYLQGFGSGQSIVDRGVQNADSMQGVLQRQAAMDQQQQQHLDQLHQQQQGHNLQLQHFDWQKSEAARQQQQDMEEAQVVGNLAKTLVKQRPSGSRIDGPTGTMVPDIGNPVDEDTLRTIDYAMQKGNTAALKYMIPAIKDAQTRARMIEWGSHLSKTNMKPADPGQQAVLQMIIESGHPENLVNFYHHQQMERHQAEQDQLAQDREERVAAHQQQQIVDAATQKDMVEQQQERVAGQLASRTAPDGTPYGDAQQYDLLKSMDSKSTFGIAHQVAAKALGLGKQPAEPQTEPRVLHVPIGGDIANEKVVSVTGSKGGTLNWDENDPIVQEFMDLAKQVQPGQDQGQYDAPGFAIAGNKESDQQYTGRVKAKAKALAQQAGWKIGGGKPGASAGGGDMLDQLINEAMQQP